VSDAALETLWKHVLERWDEPAAHEAFLGYCQEHDRLVEAAVRYRGMSGDRERAAVAKKRLDGVTLLAMAKLESQRTEPAAVRSEAGRYVLLVCFVAASLALVWYVAMRP
jgi:hypothetical protein